MKRIFLFSLLIFFLAVSAGYAEDEKILPIFLGRWKPYSHGAIAKVEVREDRLISVNPATGKVNQVQFYRPVLNWDSKSVMLVYRSNGDTDTAEFIRFSIEPPSSYEDPNIETLVTDYSDCEIDIDDFVRRTQKELQEMVRTKKCPGNRSLFDENYLSAASWTRSILNRK
ncbi:MAG: hypothetical protein JWM96_636 [Alphaproteobacteria bacterium]|nr:hypothetical protein [Alphaproteobacteria bacterium]